MIPYWDNYNFTSWQYLAFWWHMQNTLMSDWRKHGLLLESTSHNYIANKDHGPVNIIGVLQCSLVLYCRESSVWKHKNIFGIGFPYMFIHTIVFFAVVVVVVFFLSFLFLGGGSIYIKIMITCVLAKCSPHPYNINYWLLYVNNPEFSKQGGWFLNYLGDTIQVHIKCHVTNNLIKWSQS